MEELFGGESATDKGFRVAIDAINISGFEVTDMTEKIGFGKGLGPVALLNAPRKATNVKPGDAKSPADRVDFSAVLQEVSKTQGVQDTAAAARMKKVAELREQVANGTYRPDLDKVAASLVKFMDDEA